MILIDQHILVKDCLKKFEELTAFSTNLQPIDNHKIYHHKISFALNNCESDLVFGLIVYPNLTQDTIKSILSEPGIDIPRTVMITEYADLTTSQLCLKNNLNFMDLSGNILLKSPPILFVCCEGQPPQKKNSQRDPIHTVLQEKGLAALFAILAKKSLSVGSTRAIAAESGVSIGTVSKVLRFLKETNHIVDDGRDRFEMVDKEQLLRLWSERFNQFLRPRMLLRRYSAKELNWFDSVNLPQNACWGGQIAMIDSEDRYKFYKKTFIYTAELPENDFSKSSLLPDKQGNIYLMKANLSKKINIIESGKVSPILLYADLLYYGQGQGSEELAQKLQEEICQY